MEFDRVIRGLCRTEREQLCLSGVCVAHRYGFTVGQKNEDVFELVPCSDIGIVQQRRRKVKSPRARNLTTSWKLLNVPMNINQ